MPNPNTRSASHHAQELRRKDEALRQALASADASAADATAARASATEADKRATEAEACAGRALLDVRATQELLAAALSPVRLGWCCMRGAWLCSH